MYNMIFPILKEKGKIISEINSLYFTKYKDKYICAHRSVGIDDKYYIYYFENHGYNDYIFIDKVVNEEDLYNGRADEKSKRNR